MLRHASKLACAALLLGGTASALPLGNPYSASLGACYDLPAWRPSICNAITPAIGYYGNFVYNRHLEGDDDDVERTEVFTNAAYYVVNLWSLVDFFVTTGTTSLRIDTNALMFGGANGSRFLLTTDSTFSWSVGGRLTIWECASTFVGIEAQYAYAHPHIRRITLASTDSIHPGHQVGIKYEEWQFGIAVAHRIGCLVPYLGAKVSGARLNFDNATLDFAGNRVIIPDLDTRFLGGYAVGVSLLDCERALVSVEASFRDETALSVIGEVRF